MKKAFILLAVVLMGLCQFSSQAMSCAAVSVSDNQETTEPCMALSSIIKKAKAEGASWTEQQWKDAVLSVSSILEPMGKLATEIAEKLKTNPNEVLALAGKVEELEQQFNTISPLLEEFETVAKEFPIATRLVDDEDFMKEVMLKAGFTEESLNFMPGASIGDNDDGDTNDDGDDDELSMPSEYDPELLDMVNRAETNGANWTEQQWKDSFALLFQKMTPMMAKIKELSNSESEDIANLALAIELMPKIQGTKELMDRLETAAKATDIGSKMLENDDFLLQIMTETGFLKYLGDE